MRGISIGRSSRLHPGGANYNYVTVKYAANGAAVWTNRYNGPANASDLPRAMTVDKAGGVYVTGTSSSGGGSFICVGCVYGQEIPQSTIEDSTRRNSHTPL